VEAIAMAEFAAAIVLFLLAHVIPPSPPVRTRLIAWMGRRLYLVAYSLLSLALAAWVIVAALRAPYWPLWGFAPWQALVPVLVMPLAAWLLVIGLFAPNPLSVSLRAVGPDAEPGLGTAVTRHPLLWGFLLWAVSHIPPNGHVVALILFGGMAALAAGGMALLDRRARSRLGPARWQELAAATSLVPFGALVTGRVRIRPSWRLLASLALALAAYAWFLLQGHAWLIGPDPLAALMS
jgi:uncharacterized membrane protein